jgi:hypothetical protein
MTAASSSAASAGTARPLRRFTGAVIDAANP